MTSRRKRSKRRGKRQPMRGSPAARGYSLPSNHNLNSLVTRDEDLVRGPDVVKFRYATYVSEREPGRSKLARWEKAMRQGPLGVIPEIDHWAMEEFFWHGIPDDPWHPLEAYLDFVGDRLSEAGREQLRRWKEARIGFYEVGQVRGETMILREWDSVRRFYVSRPFKAITLGIGGVDFLRQYRGQLLLTYVSSWRPEEELFCSMGYGLMIGKNEVGLAELLLGLRAPDVVGRPLPWKTSRQARRDYLKTWKGRDWLPWLEERMEFPFRTLVIMPPHNEIREFQVTGLLHVEPEEVRNFWVYAEVPIQGEIQIVGLTNLIVPDVSSPNWMPVAEYRAYREQVGPPPGIRGQPRLIRL